jgi:membrane-associated phospholipid phosphatase
MPEISKGSVHVDAARALGGGAPTGFCSGSYALKGWQVEPGASWWLDCLGDNPCPAPRPITVKELLSKINPATSHYPTDEPTLKAELEELVMLSRMRDEPAALAHEPTLPITQEPQQARLPLSMFLQLRPQPLGAVVNTARGEAFPVINSGRELARYFENETPGLPFRLALDYMVREESWSPPRQAWVWAALDVTIYSALAAAWYFKWRGGPGIAFRPRPWECYDQLDILFDRVTNSTASADGPRRSFPPGLKPPASTPGEPPSPEAHVPDILPGVPPSQPTPGTPRHPAYPSGHSTYSAAAARLLREFFPRYGEQLCRLADNAGLARLWAGIHWRSDHTFGQQVGTAVAELVIDQLKATGIARFPAPQPADAMPPNPVPNPCRPGKNWDAPPLTVVAPCAGATESPV